MENSQIRLAARNSLQGKWTAPVLSVLIYLIISGLIQSIPFLGILGSLFITGAFAVGFSRMFLSIARGNLGVIDTIFSGFDSTYVRSLVTSLLQLVFVLLWTLLLIVPGIIAGLSYALSYFILVEEPELSEMQILNKSKRMMYGHKWRLFYLLLSFIPWAILCLFTFGIGFLWLAPYIQTSLAHFYLDLKENHEMYEGELPVL